MEEASQQIIMDIQNTFSTEYGKRVLEHLRGVCQARHSQNAFDDVSERQTCFNLGAQWVFNYLASRMEINLTKSGDNLMCELDEATGDNK